MSQQQEQQQQQAKPAADGGTEGPWQEIFTIQISEADLEKTIDKAAELCITIMGPVTHGRKLCKRSTDAARDACKLHLLPGTDTSFVSVTEAELLDLKMTEDDQGAVETGRKRAQLSEYTIHDKTGRPTWKRAMSHHLAWFACLRMQRLPEPLAQIVAGDDNVEEGLKILRASGLCPWRRGPALANAHPIMVPSRVTFVSRHLGNNTNNDGPATEIKYLSPHEQDPQDSATFRRNLTASFSCSRVSAPDMTERSIPTRWHVRRRFVGTFLDHGIVHAVCPAAPRTILVFAAGVCVEAWGSTRGGVGVVTKDTVHFHEAKVQERVLTADRKLCEQPGRRRHPERVRSAGLCAKALKKRNRGWRENLKPAGEEDGHVVAPCENLGGVYGFALERCGPRIDPERFGYTVSPMEPNWVTAGDRETLQRIGLLWEQERARKGENQTPDASPSTGTDTSASTDTTTTALNNNKDKTKTKTNKINNKQTTPNRTRATPARAAVRALLAATQLITPLDFGHCTRLAIATDNDAAIHRATNLLHDWLTQSQSQGTYPFTTETGEPIEDADLWWAFAESVKDLGYAGVEVVVVKCGKGDGVVVDLGGGEERVVGMPQAIEAAGRAAWRAVEGEEVAREGFVRRMGLFV